jgi:hypothetical protein
MGFVFPRLKKLSQARGLLSLLFLAVHACLFSVDSLAQDQESTSAPPPSETAVARSVRAVRVAHAPRIDGFLDEGFWKDAAVARDFVQQRPQSGEPASQPTEVSIVYTTRALYLGFVCFDDHPEEIVHRVLGRDADISADDYFTVVLDTYHDLQNGFFFQVNPNGMRRDALFRAEGASDQFNVDWDGVWRAVCRVTDEGWQGEIEIPWRTLRFSPSKSLSMGINFERQRRLGNEQSMWSPIARHFDILRVSQAGSLQGLEGIAPGSNILLRPYVLGTLSRGDAGDPSAFSRDDWSSDGTVGYDLKLGLSSNLTLDVTVNTDFAQVEVDDQQVNLTRFPLYYPEKREFFLENRDYFSFGSPDNRAFFSRRIGLNPNFETVPIEYGTRVTGKLGRTDVGFLDLKSKGLAETPDYRFDVARVSQDVGQRSRVGGILVSRAAQGGSIYNRVFGLDCDLRPGDDLDISAYGSFSNESKEGLFNDPQAFSDQPRAGPDHGSWGARVRYSRPLYYGNYLYEVYGRDYAPRVGFLPRRDIERHITELGFTPEPNWGILRSAETFLYGEWIDRRDGKFSSRNLWLQGNLIGRDDEVLSLYLSDSFERLFEEFPLGEVAFSQGDYHFRRVGFSLGSNPSLPFALKAEGELGDYFDGTLNSLSAEATGRLAPHLALSLQGESHRLHRDDAQSGVEQRFRAKIVRVRLALDFSNSLSLALFSQWNSASNAVLSQARLHYLFGDESDFYLVLTDERTDNEQNFAPRRGDLTVKLSYAIRL